MNLIYSVAASLDGYIAGPDGAHFAITKGQQRFRVLQFLDGYPFLVARIQTVQEPEGMDTEIQARFFNLRQQAVEAVEAVDRLHAARVLRLERAELGGDLDGHRAAAEWLGDCSRRGIQCIGGFDKE